jgi:phosphopantothenoylcysteine decarboxylase / phosphopantothenate---cysteine ligase
MRSKKSGHRLNFLITAGGTREYIDPVRFISNASSGRMGYQLADVAKKKGHDVILITAPANLPLPRDIKAIKVESADDMFKAVKSRFERCDCLIMAAAVSDYKLVQTFNTKIKRSRGTITLKLKPTQDILKWAGSHNRRKQLVIGFALEDRDLKVSAERKMKEKNLDIIVANEPSAIGGEKSSVWIKSRGGNWKAIKNKAKAFTAGKIIQLAETAICSKKEGNLQE